MPYCLILLHVLSTEFVVLLLVYNGIRPMIFFVCIKKSFLERVVLLEVFTNFLFIYLFYLFGVLQGCFQHCTGYIMTGSWRGRGNQYIQFVRVLYYKLLTNSKQLPAFPLEVMPGTEPRHQR